MLSQTGSKSPQTAGNHREGGTVTGPMRIEGTGGLVVEGATIGAAIDNFGSLDITANTSFTTSLINRADFTILGPRTINAERWDQRGGEITQFGTTSGTYYFIHGGSTWTLMGGIHTGTQIATGWTAGDGSYVMPGGSVNLTGRLIVGMEESGSFFQSGGSPSPLLDFLPLPEPPHFRQVPAVLHVAPLAAAVAAGVEEQPAAALAAALAHAG